MNKPNSNFSMRHVALVVKNLEACELFYTELLGMKLEWKPDPDNIYLTSGNDNLALHRAPKDFHPEKNQRLDHFGFILENKDDVDAWHNYLRENNVVIKAVPKDHRDGTRSFYCADPDGNIVQFIYHP